MKLSCRLQIWFLAFTAWTLVSSVAAQNAPPEPIYYTLRSPRPGQLDPNHRDRLEWSGTISNVAELPNGRLLIAGSVYRPGHPGFTNLAVLDRFGRVDTNAPRFLDEPPLAIASQPDGSVAMVMAGGREIQFLDPNLAVDERMIWPPTTPAGVRLVATCLTADGASGWIAGGFLETKIGQSISRAPFVHRISPAGNVRSELAAEFVTWNTNSGTVRFVRPAPDGKLLVYLSWAGGGNLVRLLPGGLPDRSFTGSARLTGLVYDAAFAADGRVVLAIDGYAAYPTTRYRVVRINPDGSLDATFKADFFFLAEASSVVKSLQIDHAGRIVIAGYFRPTDLPNWTGLARLFPDGSLDRSFFPGHAMTMAGVAERVLLIGQNRLVVAGRFTVDDRVGQDDVDPPLPENAGLSLASSGLAVLHNADRLLAAPPHLTNGVFSVESFLPATGYLILERSADMVHWQGFRTNFAAGTNWLRASFPVNEAEAGEFFRVSVRP